MNYVYVLITRHREGCAAAMMLYILHPFVIGVAERSTVGEYPGGTDEKVGMVTGTRDLCGPSRAVCAGSIRHRLADVRTRSWLHALLAAFANQCRQRRKSHRSVEVRHEAGRHRTRGRRVCPGNADRRERRDVSARGQSRGRARARNRKGNLELSA